MTYSLQSLRGHLTRRHSISLPRRRRSEMLSLNVTHFGSGYWIGGICLTLLSVLFPLTDAPHTSLLSTILLPIVVDVVTISSFAGLFLAFVHMVQGITSRNREIILSGIIGLLMCGAALLWVTIDSLQEVAQHLLIPN